MPTSKYTVGQTVYIFPFNHRHDAQLADVQRVSTCQTVGRKYGTTSLGQKFDLASGEIDAGKYSCPGIVYPSLEAWQAGPGKQWAWEQLRRIVERSVPDHMTYDAIQAILTQVRSNPER